MLRNVPKTGLFYFPPVDTKFLSFNLIAYYGWFVYSYSQCLDGFQILERSISQRLQIVIVQG